MVIFQFSMLVITRGYAILHLAIGLLGFGPCLEVSHLIYGYPILIHIHSYKVVWGFRSYCLDTPASIKGV